MNSSEQIIFARKTVFLFINALQYLEPFNGDVLKLKTCTSMSIFLTAWGDALSELMESGSISFTNSKIRIEKRFIKVFQSVIQGSLELCKEDYFKNRIILSILKTSLDDISSYQPSKQTSVKIDDPHIYWCVETILLKASALCPYPPEYSRNRVTSEDSIDKSTQIALRDLIGSIRSSEDDIYVDNEKRMKRLNLS